MIEFSQMSTERCYVKQRKKCDINNILQKAKSAATAVYHSSQTIANQS